jgi:hypothetical protein
MTAPDVSFIMAGPSDATLADSKAVSSGTRASVADSKALSVSTNASVADSKAVSAVTKTLDTIPAPVAGVSFNGQQATSLLIENRTDDTGCTQVGRVWLRTDL